MTRLRQLHPSEMRDKVLKVSEIPDDGTWPKYPPSRKRASQSEVATVARGLEWEKRNVAAGALTKKFGSKVTIQVAPEVGNALDKISYHKIGLTYFMV